MDASLWRKLLSIPMVVYAALAGSAARGSEAEQREKMVAGQIAARGVRDPRVLAAMRRVPRHEFVPREHRALAYRDQPLPIGSGQTISQPYIVAVMSELAHLRPGDRVLEFGGHHGCTTVLLGNWVGQDGRVITNQNQRDGVGLTAAPGEFLKDTLVTIGGVQSNHTRQVAAVDEALRSPSPPHAS